MNPNDSAPDNVALALEHDRVARELVRALGAGDDHGAAELLYGLTHPDAIGVAVRAAQIVVTVQRDLMPGTSVDALCDALEQGVQE